MIATCWRVVAHSQKHYITAISYSSVSSAPLCYLGALFKESLVSFKAQCYNRNNTSLARSLSALRCTCMCEPSTATPPGKLALAGRQHKWQNQRRLHSTALRMQGATPPPQRARAPGQLLFEVDKKATRLTLPTPAKGPLLSCVHGTACGRKAKAFVASSSQLNTSLVCYSADFHDLIGRCALSADRCMLSRH